MPVPGPRRLHSIPQSHWDAILCLDSLRIPYLTDLHPRTPAPTSCPSCAAYAPQQAGPRVGAMQMCSLCCHTPCPELQEIESSCTALPQLAHPYSQRKLSLLQSMDEVQAIPSALLSTFN